MVTVGRQNGFGNKNLFSPQYMYMYVGYPHHNFLIEHKIIRWMHFGGMKQAQQLVFTAKLQNTYVQDHLRLNKK